MSIRFWTRIAAIVLAGGVAACSAPNSGSAALPNSVPVASAHHVIPHRVSIGKFADPYAVAADPKCASNCNLYVADPGAGTVWLVKPDGTKTAIATKAMLGQDFDPQGVAVSPIDDAIVIADKQVYHKESIVWRIANGSATQIPGWDFRFGDSIRRLFARGVAIGPHGEVYVSMAQWTRLIISHYGTQCLGAKCWFNTIAATGSSFGVAVDSSQTTYVAATELKAVIWRPSDSPSFSRELDVGDPYGVAVSWTGNHVVIADPANKRVWYFAPNGSLIDLGTFVDPYGVAVDREGYVYVADAGSKDVWKIKLP